ncbi:seryl-tRNA synthetase [Pleurotus eryngii]|uniref:serine--tRNA ligase n=1 Tax=Pleurotus eryngii TaxID=5323 RepID=A0A9P6AAX2_PLEER|nr:seryl-tRNA synthetase [Pleurotus eryngii]
MHAGTSLKAAARCLNRHWAEGPCKRLHRCYASSAKPEHVRTSTMLPTPRIDYRAIVQNADSKARNALQRKAPLPQDGITKVASLYREHTDISATLNSKRNERSSVGQRIQRAAKDQEAKGVLLEEAKTLKEDIAQLEDKLSVVAEQLLHLALMVPNDTHPETPIGPEPAAKVIHMHKAQNLEMNPALDHVSITKALELVDFDSGSLATGSSWYYLQNEAALLEIALTNYALTVAMDHGFTPVLTPDVVRSDIASRCGFQPRDHSDPPVSQVYHIESGASSPQLILSGTAEIPLAAMFANKIFPAHFLPKKVIGLGRAFRAEAGARGADTRGLYRVHQFSKVELFAVTTPDKSPAMMEEMKRIQMDICSSLDMPFRVLDMPSEELGASAYRKYDIESWMPGRGGWGEISSLSNCTDYQARRLHIRYRPNADPNISKGGSPPTTQNDTAPALPFAHTLNGTAAAIPRLIVALLENGVELDGQGKILAVHLPRCLEPYWLARSVMPNTKIQWR